MIIIVIWVCHRMLCLLCEGFEVASSAKSSNYRSLSESESESTPAIYILAEKCFQINSDLLTLTPLWANWIELPLCTRTSLIITLFLRIKELQVLYHPSQAASLARNRKRTESNLIIIKAFLFHLSSCWFLQKNMLDLKLKSETLFFLRFSPSSTFPPYPSKWHFYRRTDDPHHHL